MKLRNNQKGFGVVEGIVIIVVIILLAFIGWFAWNKRGSTADSTSNQASSQASNSETSKTKDADADEAYLNITEWGMKIKTDQAKNVTYIIEKAEIASPHNEEDMYDEVVRFTIDPTLLTDTSCGVGVSLFRYKSTPSSSSLEAAQKIGDRYYEFFGGPDTCTNSADNEIKTNILIDLNNNNLEAL